LGGSASGFGAGTVGVKDITQAFFEHSVKVLEGAFLGQFHYGAYCCCPVSLCHLHPAPQILCAAIYYAYVKLKEQEAKNLGWMATCLKHGKRDFDRLVQIFKKED
jgi:hypothetical protein